MIESISHGGWRNNRRLTDGRLELVATLDVGPRVIRLARTGGDNFFYERAAEIGGDGEDAWKLRGGHRFWHAPEGVPRTYVLDNFPVEYEALDEYAFRVAAPAEPENGMRRGFTVRLHPGEDRATLAHTLENLGRWPVTAAGWALTVLRPGGAALVPLPEAQGHFDAPNPAWTLAAWSYTHLGDARFSFSPGRFRLDHARAKGPNKLGLSVPAGWAAYRLPEGWFVKRFAFDPAAAYPDGGSNFETYSDDEFVELETLGPLTTLAPGAALTHMEEWRVLPPMDEDTLAARVLDWPAPGAARAKEA